MYGPALSDSFTTSFTQSMKPLASARLIRFVTLIHSLTLYPVIASGAFLIGVSPTGNLFSINPETGKASLIGDTGVNTPVGLAADPYSGTVWGVNLQSDFDTLHTVDLQTGRFSLVGSLGLRLGGSDAGLTYNPNSNLIYATSEGTDSLYSIDPTTGQATEVGSTGIVNPHGLAYDHVHDILYAASGATTRSLYRVDPLNGAASLIGTLSPSSGQSGLAYDFVNEVLYVNFSSGNELYTVDVTDATTTLVGDNFAPGGGIRGLAFVVAIPEPSSAFLTSIAVILTFFVIGIRSRAKIVKAC